MAAPSLLDLGRRERQIMEVLFRLGRATVSDVLAKLPDPPSYSAVRAMLGKLEAKGHVRHVEDGPRYVYSPAGSTESAKRTAVKQLIDTFFQGSAEQAVVGLVRLSDAQLDDDALRRLTARIRQAYQEGR